MYRITILSILAVSIVASYSEAVVIKQENTAFTESTDWEYNALTNTITIKTASATETYVFWAHADGDPDTLAEIDEIRRDSNLTSGTIKLKISKTEAGLTAGATRVDAITIDGLSGITSIVEGINITGDFLSTESMWVDEISGTVMVGGDLVNAISVSQDVSEIDIQGAANGSIFLGGDVGVQSQEGGSCSG